MEVLALALVIFTLAVTIFTARRLSNGDASNLPPGSFGWPVIGETIQFLFSKPEKFVGDRMKRYSPDIFKTKILGEKTAVLCGPNGNKFIFSNEQKYFDAFRPHPMQYIFRSYQTKAAAPPPGPPHNEVKVLRQPGFLKAETLIRFLGKIDSIVQQQLQAHLGGKDVVKAYPLAKTVTLTIACRFFLGLDNPDRIARLVQHFDDVTVGMHSIMLNIPGTIFHLANKAAATIRTELLSVIKEKKEAMAQGAKMQDILTFMIVMADPSGKLMPEAEIADKMMGLLVAGYSTVATTITFMMKYVGLNPDVYEKIRAEQMEIAASKKAGEVLEWEDMQKMKYSWNVICETMRMVPPLQGTFREVLTEFTYAGYTVPKGWKVYWTASTTNMNPEYFRNPEKFDPSRYEDDEGRAPYTYVPFGGGPRTCPGKEYARLAILAFMHNVAKDYKWEVMDPHEKVHGDMMPAPEKGLSIRLHRL